MFFNSYLFLFIFLPTTFFTYFFLLKYVSTTISRYFVITMSILFYAYSSLENTVLFLFSITTNYLISKFFIFHKYSTFFLFIGITFNILLLGYYKYSNFFIETLNSLFSQDVQLLNIILPLAISFFTFQQIGFLLESYYKKIHCNKFSDYLLFITFFPQLIIGPIVKYKELVPKFYMKTNLKVNYENIRMGFILISIGLFKKVILADSLATIVNTGYANIHHLNSIDAWLSVFAFTFQVYFDFSGYTDIALGLALLFNIKLPVNFNSPYRATNIQQAWQAWHITLTRFFISYLYIPFVKRNKALRYLIILFIFAISGLWHGADWSFIFWGLSCALALFIYYIWKSIGFALPKFLAWFFTFSFIVLDTVFFRAKDLTESFLMYVHMFDFQHYYDFSLDISHFDLFILFLSIITVFYPKNSTYISEKLPISMPYAIIFSTMLFTSIIFLGKSYEFIYFNF